MLRSFEKKLDDFNDGYCRENLFSGVLRITVKDQVILERFVGMEDYESGIPFSNDSMFTFYSLSKPFCAMGLMKLRDRGLVDPDSHPGRYVPEAATFHKDLTIRQMLQHVSGMPDFELNEEFVRRCASGTIRDMVKELSGRPMLFEPGTDSKYANINFIVAALVIENVSGMTYADYMREEIFAPLGMRTARVDASDLAVPHRVVGYGLEDGKPVPVERVTAWLFGAGDIIGRVDDVYCLNRAIKHRLLLREDSWREILTPSPVSGMGLGCTVSRWHGKDRITHNGGHIGFRTLHIQLPEDDFDVILLSNFGFGNARNDFAEAIHEAYYGGGEAAENMEMDRGYI